ncbi:hypothetical protein QQP08_006851 [Theobroma cacao]|nr:hypothetical protein QQP08_006851 [Theobroma cacao]
MDDEVVQRVFQEGGRDYFQQQPSTSTSSSSSILQSLPLHVSFDHGYYLLVKSIQELREKKEGIVTVGIGGPCGSGKTSLAEKVASVIGCTVIPMENYRDGFDEGNDLDSIDFDSLVRNLEDLTKGKDTMIPVFDFQQKKRVGPKAIKSTSSSVSPEGHSTFFLKENEAQTDNFIEMYLRPPSASEEARINDWIKVRQSGIRYYLSLGDQRIVDKNFIIRPKAEFEKLKYKMPGLMYVAYLSEKFCKK